MRFAIKKHLLREEMQQVFELKTDWEEEMSVFQNFQGIGGGDLP